MQAFDNLIAYADDNDVRTLDDVKSKVMEAKVAAEEFGAENDVLIKARAFLELGVEQTKTLVKTSPTSKAKKSSSIKAKKWNSKRTSTSVKRGKK